MKVSKWLEGPHPMPVHERIGYCACFILGLIIGGFLK